MKLILLKIEFMDFWPIYVNFKIRSKTEWSRLSQSLLGIFLYFYKHL